MRFTIFPEFGRDEFMKKNIPENGDRPCRTGKILCIVRGVVQQFVCK